VNASLQTGTGAAAVLETLGVPRQRVLYVQASADWIQRAGIGVSDLLAALLEFTGAEGTLVMPTYPFHTTHQQYLESHAEYDVRRTPAGIGLLPEIFRRTTGTVRSLDPDFCVTALGKDADAIVGTEPAASDPFGTDSSYQRMIDRHATLVGLGVSLNTNSFIHVVDSRAEAGYPSPVYEDRLFPMTVIDASGRSREVLRKALRPQFQLQTSPSAIVPAMRPASAVFASLEIDGARFFRWDLARWASWCLAHARQQAAAGRWPCWLSRLDSEPVPKRLG
jgi:aminoglycoside N3'-acetyltransferase